MFPRIPLVITVISLVFMLRSHNTPEYQISRSNSSLIGQGNNPIFITTQGQILIKRRQNKIKLSEKQSKSTGEQDVEQAQNITRNSSVTKETSDPKVTSLSEKEQKEIVSKIITTSNFEGNWELVSYHLHDVKKNSFIEVAVIKDKIEIRESWYFQSGHFRHIIDKKLSSSGKYEVIDSSELPKLKNIDLIPGSDFLIHAYDVSNNFGSQTAHQYYYVEFDGSHLILYDIGRQLQYRHPNQGHKFTKVKE